MIVMLPSSLLL